MLAHDDSLRVLPATHGPDGRKLEPEERPALRVTEVSAPATLASGETVGQIPGQVVTKTTVGEAAAGMRTQCRFCRHFDRDGWRALLKELEQTKEGLRFVNAIRGRLLESGNAALREAHEGPDGDLDIEHVLSVMGLCRPQTDIFSAHAKGLLPTVSHPLGGCPEGEVGPRGEDLGKLFEPKRGKGEEGAAVYDAVMQAAQGLQGSRSR